jgi:methionyl aminopeptidase
VVCHGIPGDRRLKEGDIVNIDITVIKDGFHGDTSRMFYVGEPPVLGRRVSEIAHEAMRRGIEMVRPGAAWAISAMPSRATSRPRRCSVVREYCGHGIGRSFHEDPQVLHYGNRAPGLDAAAGMTFTIEPMVNAGAAT